MVRHTLITIDVDKLREAFMVEFGDDVGTGESFWMDFYAEVQKRMAVQVTERPNTETPWADAFDAYLSQKES